MNNVSGISPREQSTSDEMMMMSALHWTNTRWIFIVLANWNKSPLVDMSLHSDTLSWIRANPSLLLLLSVACLAEKQQIPISQLLIKLDRDLNSRTTAREESTITIISPMRLYLDRPITGNPLCILTFLIKPPSGVNSRGTWIFEQTITWTNQLTLSWRPMTTRV